MQKKTEKIKERQNEDIMLKIQFSAKNKYNNSEIINYLTWLLCICSASSIFIPSTIKLCYQILIPLFLDITIFVLSEKQRNLILTAAKYRKYFDSYVLDIKNDLSESDIKKIKTDAVEYCLRRIRKSQEQINNTGEDKVPGVKNWYYLNNEETYEEAVFKCQKENIWWNKRLIAIKKGIIYFLLIVFLISVCVVVSTKNLNNYIRILLASPIILKVFACIKETKKYSKICNQIDGAIITTENSLTTQNIQSLQGLINDMRECNVLGINLIHKLKAKKYSEWYRETTNLR